MNCNIYIHFTVCCSVIPEFSVENKKLNFSCSNKMVQQVPENINFPAEEEKILQFWSEFNCFQECLKQSKHKPKYVNSFGNGRVLKNSHFLDLSSMKAETPIHLCVPESSCSLYSGCFQQ